MLQLSQKKYDSWITPGLIVDDHHSNGGYDDGTKGMNRSFPRCWQLAEVFIVHLSFAGLLYQYS
jgi:hypothetical protein